MASESAPRARKSPAHRIYWTSCFGDFDNISTPGAELTVMEGFQFLLTNLMPRDVFADLLLNHPDLLKAFNPPPGTPGLN